MNRARLPYQVDKLPDSSAGLYILRFALPPGHHLGFGRSTFDLSASIERVGARLHAFSEALQMLDVEGVAQSTGYRGRHLGRKFHVHVRNVRESFLEATIKQFFLDSDPVQAARQYHILQQALSTLPPIYIGIAEDRSLRERVTDHVEGRTRLHNALEIAGLIWDDVCVDWISCAPFGQKLRAMEKVAQELHKPIFSRL